MFRVGQFIIVQSGCLLGNEIAMDLAVESDRCVLSNDSSKDSYLEVRLKKNCTNFRCRNPTLLDRGGLGLSTFCAANHPVESCGSNGLPLTPNSVQILGKFQSLSQLEHPNLCAYVEICRLQHGKIKINFSRFRIFI